MLPAVALGLLAFGAIACASPPSTRGWAPPEPITTDDRMLLIASFEDRLFGLQSDSPADVADAEIVWQFPPDDLRTLPVSDEAHEQIEAALADLSGISDRDRALFEELLDDLRVRGPSVDDLTDALEQRVPESEQRNRVIDLVEQITRFEEDTFDDLAPFFGDIAVSEDGQRAFIASFSGAVFALELTDAQPIWVRDAGDDIVGGIAVQGDTLYFGTKGDIVFAVSAETGELIWSVETDGEVWTTPAIADGTIYVPTLAGTLYALDSDGNVLWTFEEPASGVATKPIVEAGAVFIGSFDQTLYAVDAETGDLRWKKAGNNWFWATPLFEEGTVFAATLDGTVYAVDAETGEDRWAEPFDTDDAIRGGPTVAGGGLVVSSVAGLVFKLDLETGEELARPLDTGDDIFADLVSQEDVVFVSPRAPRLFIVDASGDRLRFDTIALRR